MSKISQIFSKLKNANDEMFLNVEKITIVNRKKIYIQNYKEIYEIGDTLIKFAKVTIKGQHLKIVTISKYFVEISGDIIDVNLGDVNDGQ